MCTGYYRDYREPTKEEKMSFLERVEKRLEEELDEVKKAKERLLKQTENREPTATAV